MVGTRKHRKRRGAKKAPMKKKLAKVSKTVSHLARGLKGQMIEAQASLAMTSIIGHAATDTIANFVAFDLCANSQGFPAAGVNDLRVNQEIFIDKIHLNFTVKCNAISTIALNGVSTAVRFLVVRYLDGGTGYPNSTSQPTLQPTFGNASMYSGAPNNFVESDLWTDDVKAGGVNAVQRLWDHTVVLAPFDANYGTKMFHVDKWLKINKVCTYNNSAGALTSIQRGRIVLLAATNNIRPADAGPPLFTGTGTTYYTL